MAKKQSSGKESPYPEYDNLSLPELARALKEVQAEKEEREAEKTAAQKRFDYLRLQLIPEKMEDQEITSMKIKGVGRLQLSPDAWTQTLDRDKLLGWLREHEFGDLIREDVNPSTLKAFAKAQIKNGEELPPDDAFKFTPYMRASVVKG